jgi:glycosyltransferase involved in cell wall biosynthesis
VNPPPLVSICIPTYNRRDLLAKAIRSCQAQTYPHFEIIITDNSTTDDSAKMVASLAEPRIRYFRNEKNLGGLGNVEKGLGLVRGKYVKLLMDDDIIKPRSIELMVDVFERNPTVGVVMAPMEMIDGEDRRIMPYFYVCRKMYYRYRFQVGDGLVERRRVLREYLVHDYPCCVPSGVLYKAECFEKLGKLDFKSDFAADLELAMRFAAHYDFYYIDQVLSGWRFLPASHTATLHVTGLNLMAFYYITRKTLADPVAMSYFTPAEQKRLRRDALYFCSCRAVLNILAGIKGLSPKLVMETISTIRREDPYLWNWLRLPWFVVREVLKSFIPPAKPLPRE